MVSTPPCVTFDRLLTESRGLLEPGEEANNPEYVRGMAELIARCFPGADLDTGTWASAMTMLMCNGVMPVPAPAAAPAPDLNKDALEALEMLSDFAGARALPNLAFMKKWRGILPVSAVSCTVLWAIAGRAHDALEAHRARPAPEPAAVQDDKDLLQIAQMLADFRGPMSHSDFYAKWPAVAAYDGYAVYSNIARLAARALEARGISSQPEPEFKPEAQPTATPAAAPDLDPYTVLEMLADFHTVGGPISRAAFYTKWPLLPNYGTGGHLGGLAKQAAAARPAPAARSNADLIAVVERLADFCGPCSDAQFRKKWPDVPMSDDNRPTLRYLSGLAAEALATHGVARTPRGPA
jgi:hypothetical protein